MKKLTLIQNELKAPKNQYNSFGKYKYRSQEDILESVKPLLLKHECSLYISDEIKEAGSVMYVETTCTFSDGKETKVVKAQAGIDINRKGMDIAQCFGSSSSYSRKYGLSGLFLLDDTKDADATNTHGNEPANNTQQQPKQQQKAAPNKTQPQPEKATKAEKEKLCVLLNNSAITQEEKVKALNSVSDLTPDRCEKAILYYTGLIAERSKQPA